MLDRIVRPAKKLLRGPYRQLEKKYVRQFRGFTSADLSHVLRQQGVVAGDAIFVHSAMPGFAGFRGGVADIVRVFQEAVCPGGALLMPTIPFGGSALDHASSGKIFDPAKTPSQVGLITEIFRRFPDVKRTVHPTHPIAVWGTERDWWAADKPDLDTPCGRGTLFDRLHQKNGKIILAGVSITCLTHFHYAEEILENRLPFSPFTSERFSFPCRVNGQLIQSSPMRLYDPAISRRRQLLPLAAELQKTGRWKQGRVGTLEVTVLQAREILQTLEEMADRGVFCYRGE